MIGAPARAILRAHSPGLWPSPSPWGPETQSKSQYSSVICHMKESKKSNMEPCQAPRPSVGQGPNIHSFIAKMVVFV